jgi:hypothetical protein
VADKPSEQGASSREKNLTCISYKNSNIYEKNPTLSTFATI